MLPELITASDAIVLIITSFFTSMMTAAMGIGGGMLLLAIMASIVPIIALIPAHAVVQMGSNANRAVMTRQHIDSKRVKRFMVGALLAALIAPFIVVQLPIMTIQLAVACFILFLVWGPKLGNHEISASELVAVGTITTLISMLVGATGPLVAAFIHRMGYDRYKAVATLAACMTLQHLLKIAVFSAIGFAFFDWLPLLLTMILMGGLGTKIGLHALDKIPAERFHLIFKLTISVLAIRLIYQSIT